MGSHARPDWTPQEIALLKELCDSGLYRFDKLAEKMGRPRHGVMYKCYEQGFQNRYRYHLYTHNRRFFSTITPETCYWAGVITTDGCLMIKKGSAVLNLTAAVKDKAHIERFKAAIGATNPIHHRSTKCDLSTRDPEALHEHCRIDIDNAKEYHEDLARVFNITPNKTLRGAPPELPSLYHRLCFMRGFIDGDGSISSGVQMGTADIQICGCNREMIAWMKEVVESLELPNLRSGTPPLLSQPPGEQCYYYHIRGLAAAVLFELLGRLPLPRLSRKWDNQRVLPHVQHWKDRSDVWPPEVFFTSLLAEPALDSASPSPSTLSTLPLLPAAAASVSPPSSASIALLSVQG